MPANYLQKIKSIFIKFAWFLPFVSLFAGIISAVLITRDYTKSFKLLSFSCGFLIVTLLMSLWYNYTKSIAEKDINKFKKFSRSLYKRKKILEFVGLSTSQYFVQYIFMFCIPFLFIKNSWYWLFVLFVFSILSFWDPFWNYLFKFSFFRLLIRLITSCLVFSFLFPTIFPQYLKLFYSVFTIICLIIIFPWRIFFLKASLTSNEIFSTLIMTSVVILHEILAPSEKFPVISIWLNGSYFSIEKPSDNSFTLIKNNIISYNDLNQNLKIYRKVCAISPVVSPFGLHEQVIHEWYLNGKLIEKIYLPKIQGSSTGKQFQTFSCKGVFPSFSDSAKISVKSFLINGIYIGEEYLYIKKFSN